MDDMNAFEHQVANEVISTVRPPGPVDVMAVVRAATSTTPRWRFQSMFSVTKFVVAGLVVALFGGFVISGVLFQQSAEDASLAAAPAESPAATSPAATPDYFGADPPSGIGASPRPCPAWEPLDRSILWETTSARFEADSMDMRNGPCAFTGVGSLIKLHSDPGDQDSRTLEVNYEEQGDATRFYVYFGADETHWWVSELSTPVGSFREDPSVRSARDSQLFKTPRGETFEGDVQFDAIPGVQGELTISGLRLTAFAPGTGPGPLPDCKPAKKKGQSGKPLKKGQPLNGSGILKMTPEEAETLLRDLGLCFTFRYSYPFPDTPDENGGGYSERWCTAPPAGRVGDVAYLPNGEIVVFVGQKEPRPPRTQPPEGWNCPAN